MRATHSGHDLTGLVMVTSTRKATADYQFNNMTTIRRMIRMLMTMFTMMIWFVSVSSFEWTALPSSALRDGWTQTVRPRTLCHQLFHLCWVANNGTMLVLLTN
jgi:hypothetical protein